MILSDGSLFIHSFINAYFHAIETFLIQVGQKKEEVWIRGTAIQSNQPLVVDDNQSETQTYNTEETKAIDLLFIKNSDKDQLISGSYILCLFFYERM